MPPNNGGNTGNNAPNNGGNTGNNVSGGKGKGKIFLLMLVAVAIGVALYFFVFKNRCPKQGDFRCDSCTQKEPICNKDTKYKWSCPEKNSSDCPDYTGCQDTQNKTCNAGTCWKWTCSDKSCPGNPQNCDVNQKAECIGQDWHCVNIECKQGDTKPSAPCNNTNENYNQQWECENNEWVCQKSCLVDDPSPESSCQSNQHRGCDGNSTGFVWGCVDDTTDVCGTSIKPDCSGAICMQWKPEEEWGWKCPGDLDKGNIVQYLDLTCKKLTNKDTKEYIEVCFDDVNKIEPIHPTIGKTCKSDSSTATNTSVNKNWMTTLGNELGHILEDDEDLFLPFDTSKRIYYQPEGQPEENKLTCILYDNLNGPCENEGKFIQTTPNVSKEGTCHCTDTFPLGEYCQYSGPDITVYLYITKPNNSSHCPKSRAAMNASAGCYDFESVEIKTTSQPNLFNSQCSGGSGGKGDECDPINCTNCTPKFCPCSAILPAFKVKSTDTLTIKIHGITKSPQIGFFVAHPHKKIVETITYSDLQQECENKNSGSAIYINANPWEDPKIVYSNPADHDDLP